MAPERQRQRGSQQKQKRSVALVASGCVFGGMAPASDGEENAPGQIGPAADASSARHRPEYPLVAPKQSPRPFPPVGREDTHMVLCVQAQDTLGGSGSIQSNLGKGMQPGTSWRQGWELNEVFLEWLRRIAPCCQRDGVHYNPNNLNILFTNSGEFQYGD